MSSRPSGTGRPRPNRLRERAGAAERGIRILCDFLTVMGFLTKNDSHYGLAPDAAMFLDRRSPAYMGSAAHFLDAPEMLRGLRSPDRCGAQGRHGDEQRGNAVGIENPIWVEFARSMAPMMMMPAEVIFKLVEAEQGRKVPRAGYRRRPRPLRHQHRPAQSAGRNRGARLGERSGSGQGECRKSGVESRYSTIAGSAFDVGFRRQVTT